MAAEFKVGQTVVLKAVIPQGTITELSVSQEGDIHYLFSWEDLDGVSQERWFKESELTLA